uniref:Coiled-coil protein 142 C-terminal domain-containing protein n=1 Tax=Rhodnius prolixus TaxID=13249 RepID=T1HAZ7_RHOPR
MMNISKWLPQEDTTIQEYVFNCKKLNRLVETLICKLGNLPEDAATWKELEEVSSSLDAIAKLFIKISGDHRAAIVANYKCKYWRKSINNKRLSIMYLLSHVITEAIGKFLQDSEHLTHILKLIVFFDTILPLGSGSDSKSTSIVRNTCPSMLLPMRKLSLTKILQIIAQLRAEECGQQLVYILMNIKLETDRSFREDDYPTSDNSSMEVYRALTENMSPAHLGTVTRPNGENQPQLIVNETSMLEGMIAAEYQRLKLLFETMGKETPERLGPSSMREARNGECRMTARAKQKIIGYYQEILWGLVGAHAEYSLIWKGIGFHGETCSHWASWLKRFTTNVNWDFMFRKALVAAAYQNSTYLVNDYENGTKTGLLFKEMFTELVLLSNSCEGSNWTVAALEELPLTEQIPILHRLDHSVHTVRLWAEGKARQLSNMWNMDQFFRVTQVDVTSSITALEKRHVRYIITERWTTTFAWEIFPRQLMGLLGQWMGYANQNDLLGPECSVHVMVCGKMRAKLVSEVNENFTKLKCVPNGSIDVLAKVCRIYSLANLKLIFPDAKYWKQQFDEIPQYASSYVEDYLEVILKPVIQATTELDDPLQQRASCLVLDIMCEAWLDHIYQYKIKFTEWGALQLLADFGAVPTWLMERVEATPNLLCTEMLRRCEGVGRLLLSQPGHRIPMIDKTIRSYQGENESSPTRMPPEMYVPNQTQWLELRAQKNNYFSLCCTDLHLVR